jgi:hypothetical protein
VRADCCDEHRSVAESSLWTTNGVAAVAEADRFDLRSLPLRPPKVDRASWLKQHASFFIYFFHHFQLAISFKCRKTRSLIHSLLCG